MVNNLDDFRTYYLSKHPNVSKAQLAELDKVITKKKTEQAIQTFSTSGIDPSKIPTDDISRAVMLEQIQQGTFKTPQTQAEKDRDDTLNKIVVASNNLKNVLDNKNNLSKEDYETQRNYWASQVAAAKGFAEGGKVLSQGELSILAGQIPIMKKKVPTLLDTVQSWFTGELPNVTDTVQDSDKKLRDKAQLLLNQFGSTGTQNTITTKSGNNFKIEQ